MLTSKKGLTCVTKRGIVRISDKNLQTIHSLLFVAVQYGNVRLKTLILKVYATY